MTSGYNSEYVHRLAKNTEVPANAIPLSETDVLQMKYDTVQKMSIKDTLVIVYLYTHIGFSLSDICNLTKIYDVINIAA